VVRQPPGCSALTALRSLPLRWWATSGDLPSAAVRWRSLAQADLALSRAGLHGTHLDRRAATICPRAVLTKRARAEVCCRVGKDAHAVAAVARGLKATCLASTRYVTGLHELLARTGRLVLDGDDHAGTPPGRHRLPDPLQTMG
jgi:hypothetical protein